MAKESRKQKRSTGNGRGGTPTESQTTAIADQAAQSQVLSAEAMKSMFVRLGLIVVAVWVVCGAIAGISSTDWVRWVSLGTAALITLAFGGIAFWAIRRARSAQGVAGILAQIRTEEDRKQALAQLDSQFKSNDAAAIFAKAQLQMQEEPREALRTLEQIDLSKAVATVADEARAQRGMIHLMLGEPSKARDLADGIDLSRHQDARSKAMMSSVIAEAWARTGHAKKGLKTLEVFNPEDDLYEQLRPQLYRARAYAYAYANDPKSMKKALRRLAQIDPRLLGGMLVKKSHPMLQKEARQLLEQSGQVQRRVQFQR